VNERFRLIAWLGLLGWAGSVAAADPEGRVTAFSGFDYSVGKYGGTRSTEIVYIPFGARYETGRWTARVTVPWVQITGPGNVVNVSDPLVVGSDSGAPRTRESGLGDVVVSAGYAVYEGRDGFFLDAIGKVKFGTADEKKGLGTGEKDYSLQADLSRLWGRVTGFGTLGYRVVGSPPGLELHNVWFASLGVAYRNEARTTYGATYDYRQASREGAPSPRDFTLYMSTPFSAQTRAQLYLTRGLSDASADWAVGALVGYGF